VTHSPAISLADTLRAFARLAPGNDHSRRQIQSLLGLGTPPELPTSLDLEVKQAAVTLRPSSEVGSQAGTGASHLPRKPASPGDRLPRLAVVSSGPLPTGFAPWKTARPLDPFQSEIHLKGVARHDPLFRPNWLRGILLASLSTPAAYGPLDVSQLVERMARGELVKELPRLPLRSLRRGVQILLDRGEGMQPYARDQRELVRALGRIVGSSLVTSAQFIGCPTRKVGSGPVWTWRPYEPPGPGTPLLLLSDLGIGRSLAPSSRAPSAEWVSFARSLVNRLCPIIAFVPYPESRWPGPMARNIWIIPWDRTTSVKTVRRAIGRFAEVRK